MFTYKKHVLLFNKPATTSRGSLRSHTVYYIIKHHENLNIYGIGEAAPLVGLSIDAVDNFEIQLQNVLNNLNNGVLLKNIDLTGWPAIEFGIETALADLNFGGTRKICDNPFIQNKPIAINGLVWMNQAPEMLQEAEQKIAAGFNCIKFKIGALDFDEECRLLESIRKKHNAFKLEIRTDANGAFANADVFEKLNELKRFDIHSIEQPVKAKQTPFMQEVCAKSPIPVALDEELIGIQQQYIATLLRFIKPQYLILKPTLIGGLAKSKIWIDHAQQQGINWWFTSALESNIGLNAIAQYCSSLNTQLPQGLGTGSLYKNNIASPLEVANGFLKYNINKPWLLSEIV
ncbi:MAG: o-succinylbenzoate synthase [Bacteroidota bacterium]